MKNVQKKKQRKTKKEREIVKKMYEQRGIKRRRERERR
jgi:hypothetical protein